MVDLGKNSRSSRMHWTDDKVRHLIQVVCYVNENPGRECNNENSNKSGILLKKGYRVKWKSVSELMKQKGFSVSPEQCFDKFYDLTKRCKRLNDLLGIGTSEKVVKNPALLDSLEHLPETTKNDARKLLGSRPLFYQEIRNYHSRPHIPAAPGMQSSTPRSSDDHEALGAMRNENGGNDNNDEVGEDSHNENDRDAGADGIVSFPKRMKLSHESKRASDLNPENINPVMSGLLPDNARTTRMQPDNAKTILMQPSDNVHKCMRFTAPENLNPVISGMLLDNARTTRMQPDNVKTTLMQPSDNVHECMIRSTSSENLNLVISGTLPDNARTARMQPDTAKTPSMLEKERFKWQNIELKRVKLENDTDAYGIGYYPKRMKLSKESEGASNLYPENLNLAISGMLLVNARTAQMQPSDNLDECIRPTAPEKLSAVISGMFPDSAKTAWMLEKQRLGQNIELKSVKLENEEMKLENECMALQLKEKDGELEALQLKQKDRELENEKMKVENERMALQQKEKYRELKRKVDLEKKAFELEKMKFENERMALQLKQDRELERLKLENEKLKLHNERMTLQLKNERMALQLKQKQKELEIEYNKSEAATTPHAPTLKRFHGRKQT